MPVATPREGEVVMLMEHMNGMPLQVKQIREWTRRDRVLSRVHQWLLQGSWPRECTDPEEGIKKMGEGSVETKLSRFLFKYRSTPQTTTGATPAELLMNRRIRTQLDLNLKIQSDRIKHQKRSCLCPQNQALTETTLIQSELGGHPIILRIMFVKGQNNPLGCLEEGRRLPTS
ncbi:hypothetical protein AAFF_G00136550 [Aldrovandia affinis]|uniref:Uncharacterized protein n=1 Tax=Aldrovandia affinis TaxID=143900 RepID=A0AAD7RQ02_9TELE|nr:hypothetical protein AAFF_G00136550 [Aldrovandia affinis]